MRRSLLRLSIPLREPFVTSMGVVAARELAVIRLEDDDGTVGWGEAAPLESYDGVTVDEVVDALRDGPPPRGAPPQARAAWELAELDLQMRRRGRALGEPGADAIPVNMTLPAGPPEEVAAAAAAGLRAGYSCFKVKVGLPDDGDRVAAVREAIGPWPALRLDANGAWSAAGAVAAVTALEPLDLQLVEQPCSSLEEMAEMRPEVGVPVAADESIHSAEDVRLAASLGACAAVNVKLSSSGGFGPARAALRAARDAGLQAWLSSTLDGPWGIAAALQLAAGERLTLACGLATLELFDAEVAGVLPPPVSGLMSVPQGPGLGVEISDAALAEVVVEEIG
ncbi:MAG: mandelate racemase/muconate lactonizing enzyme family protein [Actinomycetota bacterium]|nr:mandelate racemase/muconate lactonizing enzyme family protein [Actinomycetota bacterium]